MSVNYVILNGVQVTPTSIERDEDKIGSSRRMGDGTLRYYHRAFKNKFTLHWSSLREDRLTPIRNVANLTTAFVFTDVEGSSFNVLILPGGFKWSLSAERQSRTGVKYFDVDLVLDQV